MRYLALTVLALSPVVLPAQAFSVVGMDAGISYARGGTWTVDFPLRQLRVGRHFSESIGMQFTTGFGVTDISDLNLATAGASVTFVWFPGDNGLYNDDSKGTGPYIRFGLAGVFVRLSESGNTVTDFDPGGAFAIGMDRALASQIKVRIEVFGETDIGGNTLGGITVGLSIPLGIE